MISLLHPSRGRAKQSWNTTREWIKKAGVDTQLILSLDESDYTMAYFDEYKEGQIQDICIINNNSSVVEATNKAAQRSTGDIFVYVSDDMYPQQDWGLKVIEATKNETGPWLLKVDDCLQSVHTPVVTVPIMSRSLYDRLGYFWHPGYKSMFVDEDLYWTAKKLCSLRFADHIKIEHRHPSNGKAKDDETYRRSASNWDQGKAFFKQRRAQGFPV